MSIQVIGAGFGRTGTKSLQLALEQLGFGKCYHMEMLLRNPGGIQYWNEADKTGNTDWNSLFKDEYHSIVDFPGSIYYQQLANYYPEAKVVLTVRDPEKWYESVRKTIFAFDPGIGLKLKMLLMLPFSSTARNLFKVILHNDSVIWKKLFNGKFKDKAYAIQRYQEHIEEVKRNIPANRLLVYEVKEGWEPLCQFLNKPVPDTPFPNTNKGEDFHTWATGIVKDTLS